MGFGVCIIEYIIDYFNVCGYKFGFVELYLFCFFFIVEVVKVILEIVCIVVVLDCIKEFGLNGEFFFFDVLVVLFEVYFCGI